MTLRTPTRWYVGTDYHGPHISLTFNCLNKYSLGMNYPVPFLAGASTDARRAFGIRYRPS